MTNQSIRLYMKYWVGIVLLAISALRFAIDLAEEISKGQRVVEMQDLFTSDTVGAGRASYRWFEIRFTIVKIAVVAAILVLIAGVAVFVVKKLRGPRGGWRMPGVRRRQTHEKSIWTG